MSSSDQSRMHSDIEHLRKTLDAEFEEFVSMTAHNLREPLRDVASFSQLMAETSAGRLDSEASGYLERIQAGAHRMESLLTDVVDYWSAGTGDPPHSPTDMEGVLCQALLSMEMLIGERNAVVSHDPLPAAVPGNFELLSRVLLHLIRNGIEYCDTPSPRVHISSGRMGLEWVFSVKDDGPGIDPAFQGRIFGAFKRLHGREHPGNGLGLAFCKRAIGWHGGRMWMESTPGTGSTFYFTLPAAD